MRKRAPNVGCLQTSIIPMLYCRVHFLGHQVVFFFFFQARDTGRDGKHLSDQRTSAQNTVLYCISLPFFILHTLPVKNLRLFWMNEYAHWWCFDNDDNGWIDIIVCTDRLQDGVWHHRTTGDPDLRRGCRWDALLTSIQNITYCTAFNQKNFLQQSIWLKQS